MANVRYFSHVFFINFNFVFIVSLNINLQTGDGSRPKLVFCNDLYFFNTLGVIKSFCILCNFFL